jgi:hypothetical protein
MVPLVHTTAIANESHTAFINTESGTAPFANPGNVWAEQAIVV